ncbi:MAG TPA: D-sedoheptulose 7-phosphate isomerase [Candidatus Acidoferrales bacterium]|nr:D-sedoheptulose 7-phosphate isomerase [Candidatus Acidoferrales bacterium]
MPDFTSQIRSQLRESAEIKQRFSNELLERISRFAEASATAIQQGHKIVFFGNGGSAADAQHLAAELVVRLHRNRGGLPAIALTTNTSVLTAAANDFGFESIFSRQIESLVSAGDVLVAISTSGKSPNILRGAEAGRARRAFVVGMTGEAGGELASRVDLLINVPSQDAQRVQESHITIGHIVCGLIEQICCRPSGN